MKAPEVISVNFRVAEAVAVVAVQGFVIVGRGAISRQSAGMMMPRDVRFRFLQPPVGRLLELDPLQ